MVRLFKMAANVCLLSWIFRRDCIEVSLDPVHTPQFCLAHIFFLAGFASDTINDIWAFTGHIFASIVTSAHIRTGYMAQMVQNNAIFAIFIAFIACFTIQFTIPSGWLLDLRGFGLY